ncbi:MAG: hypothetical protein WA902_23990 [Thermosynechococcaceae cyanobacterium]
MLTSDLNQNLEQYQSDIDPWDTPLSEPVSKPEPMAHPSQIASPPILSPVSAPTPCSGSSAESPTVESLLHWGLKLPPKSLTFSEWKDALALLMWQASVLRLSQVLIEDELKLKACRKGTLRTQIQDALALLFWLGNDGAMSHA